jgi:hypothetical protein
MIQIENLTVTEESLTLDYRVSNPFTYHIWICEDVDDYGRYDVETRIADGTLQIELRGDLEANLYISRVVYAKYRWLSPGESHSGRILLKLPVRNGSPRYDFGEFGKEQKRVVLHSAVLKVGYFEKYVWNIAWEKYRKGERPTNEEVCMDLLLQLAPGAERRPHSDNIVYLPHWCPRLSMEESAKVAITDVDIPCSVVVDDK